MQDRTWRHASREEFAKVRDMLLRRGAIRDKDLKNPAEAWRLRIEKVVFTGYHSGSIYCNGGSIPELPFFYKSISGLLDQP